MSDILFLAHRIPFPPDRGDKIRSHHFLKALTRIAPVHVATFAENVADRAQEPDLAEIAASYCLADRRKPLTVAGIEALLTGKPVSLAAFDSREVRDWVRHTIARHDITTIFVFSGQMGQYIPDEFAGRVVTDLCDVDSAKFEAYAEAGSRRWINDREGRLLSEEEERIAYRSDLTLLVSESEAELFRERLRDAPKARIQSLGNGVDTHYFDPAAVRPHPALADGVHFVFTGQMDYAPNVSAVQRFAKRVLPKLSGARFHIVGRAPTRDVKSLSKSGSVEVWGEVPDVRPFLAGASTVVAPLEIARGVQNKVLEAMAMARPVLLTPEAATGIPAQSGIHFMVCDDDQALVAGGRALLAAPEQARAMGRAARSFVEDRMSWDSIYRQVGAIVACEECERNAA